MSIEQPNHDKCGQSKMSKIYVFFGHCYIDETLQSKLLLEVVIFLNKSFDKME